MGRTPIPTGSLPYHSTSPPRLAASAAGPRRGAGRWVLWLVAILTFAGCDTAYSELDPRCDPAQDTAQVAGIWTIHGSGSRTGCDDAQWNTDHFDLTSVPLEITQQGDQLSLDEPPDGATTFQLLDASVTGRCVWFTTMERGDFGQVRYDFRGAAAGSHSVAGEISGQGPGGCHIEGTFSVDIR